MGNAIIHLQLVEGRIQPPNYQVLVLTECKFDEKAETKKIEENGCLPNLGDGAPLKFGRAYC
jgi:hypothetical protein